jgi:hypothetical protein
MKRRLFWSVVAVVMCYTTASCSGGADGPDGSASTGSASAGGTHPRLALQKDLGHGAFGMANVHDALEVSKAGCFVLGRNLLIAPNGSTVLSDGSGIKIAGGATFKIGGIIAGGGEYGEFANESEVPAALKGCFSSPPFWYLSLTSVV